MTTRTRYEINPTVLVGWAFTGVAQSTLTMRPACRPDRDQVTDLLTECPDGQPGWDDYAARVPLGRLWLLTSHYDVLGIADLGVGAIVDWPTVDATEPAYTLAAVYARPGFCGRQIERLIAWWSPDYAARHGATWVQRCADSNDELITISQDHGWSLHHVIDYDNGLRYLLARHAERQPHLVTREDLDLRGAA